jgi:uncharacterized protein (TIGR00369 family)
MSDEPKSMWSEEMAAQVDNAWRDLVPHNAAIGIEVVRIRVGEVWTRLKWAEKLVGNPATGVIHGGALSTLLDASGGLAVATRIGRPSPIATLDLRIDYMRPAERAKDIQVRMECYAVRRSVAFVRGVAFHDDESDPIATCAATFARKHAAEPGERERRGREGA